MRAQRARQRQLPERRTVSWRIDMVAQFGTGRLGEQKQIGR